MNNWILVIGAIFGALAVATGAFGAHALQNVLDERAQGWYDTAVTYHARHALALVACGLAALLASSMSNAAGSQRLFASSAVCFAIGITLFSGSLYVMAFTGVTRLGIITPFGGALLIAGWLLLAFSVAKLRTCLLYTSPSPRDRG